MKRVALVTGGTKGLGLEIVHRLISDNYIVYSIARSFRDERDISDVYFHMGDVTNIDSLTALSDIININVGRLDLLVNNAGIIASGGIEDIDYDNWNNVMNVNVNGVFNCTKVMLPLLKKSDSSSIVNISSISSKIVSSSMAYSCSKSAVDMITKCLAKDLAKHNIRVNSISPGIMKTGFQINNSIISENEYNDFIDKCSCDYPFGIVKAEEVAELVSYLGSFKASCITGANITIDGGRSLI